MKVQWFVGLAACLLLVSVLIGSSRQAGNTTQLEPRNPRPAVSFNQDFIEGLYSELAVDDPDVVFGAIFAALNEEAVMYQSGGHYYFTMNANAKTLVGNLMIRDYDANEASVMLAYFSYDENGVYQDRAGIKKEFSSEDGVFVECLGSLAYSVTYSGKTVAFRFPDNSGETPAEGNLAEDEVLIAPIFDESALKFFLIFNRQEKHFMYTLNENGFTPEEFLPVNDDVLLGRRTGYLFYSDDEHDRKILIGVNANSTRRNNWYDGPFDQVPGTQPHYDRIVEYVLEAYPQTEQYFEDYGGPTPEAGYGVSIRPYDHYYSIQQVAERIEECSDSSLSRAEFYKCITADFTSG